jgi:hypothetical protein
LSVVATRTMDEHRTVAARSFRISLAPKEFTQF